MHVAELAQKLALDGLGLHLELRNFGGACDDFRPFGVGEPAGEKTFVEIEPRRPHECQGHPFAERHFARERAQSEQVLAPFAPAAERAVDRFQRFVGDELALIVRRKERERALIIANRQPPLERRPRRRSSFQVVDGGCFARVATSQVPRQDGRRKALGKRTVGQVLAQPAVHAHALEGVQGNVSDVAGEGITEVDVVPLFVAQAAGEEARQGLLILEGRQRDDVVHAQRAAGDGQPIDNQMLDGG